jgi:hypothetical protein
MLLKKFCSSILGLAVFTVAALTLMPTTQSEARNSVIAAPVDEKTAIRLYYYPEGDYFHSPLIFRAVQQSDPRLDTAPMGNAGRDAYVSLSEMKKLIVDLGKTNLVWQESDKAEPFESFKKLPWSDYLEINIVCTKGTAKANLDPKKICDFLKPLDPALTTPRALWELQRFRLNYGCKVPGFDYHAYPDH